MQPDLRAGRATVARRYDYEDRTVIAADFGADVSPVVDVVDGTAIVVLDDDQHELDLPEGDVETFTRNGVVTIEVRG